MDTMSQSLNPDDWNMIGRIFLKIIENSMKRGKNQDSYIKDTFAFIESNLHLQELEQVIVETFQ